MFNLTVSEAHTYYVGDNEWLVHNVVCELKYKKGWSDAQKAEADAKVATLNAGPRTVTAVASRTNQRATYERAYGPVAPNQDVDHVIDLKLGGFDDLMNYNPLNSSVNRSLGAQISRQIKAKGLNPGDQFTSFTITSR